jgi:hypothetical protein
MDFNLKKEQLEEAIKDRLLPVGELRIKIRSFRVKKLA